MLDIQTEVQKLRAKAHNLAAKIWGQWDDPDADKDMMYKWLKAHSFSGHMGEMGVSELRLVIGKLKLLKSQNNGRIKRLRAKQSTK